MARTDQPHKLTYEAFVAKCTDFSNPLNEKHRDLDYSKPESKAAWNGSKSKIPIWCTVHEEFFIQLPANHMALGQGCPKCGKETYKDKRRKVDPFTDMSKVHNGLYDYSKANYVNAYTPIEIVCPTHGSFFQKPNAHLSGHGCPSCWETRRRAMGVRKTEDYKIAFADRAQRVHGGAYTILSQPENSHDEVRLSCPKHGEFTQKAYSHLDGHGCPSCGRVTSYTQKELAAFVESLGVEIEHDNRTVLGGRHIDIWVPSKNLGIEYHGLYWHTEDRVGGLHREKYDKAVAAGIRLIQVFDFEWLERREAVENRLRGMIAQSDPVAARKCEVRKVNNTDSRVFFKRYHTQGPGQNPLAAYGLYHDGELVACMSFGASRFTKEGWELMRYATKGRVQGGFNRLLSAFVSAHSPDVITSYCDLRWGNGEVYKQAGFALEKVTPPDYWYVDKDRRVSRYAVQNRPEGMSEREWVESMGYKKVLGVGHQRWVWRA